MSYIEKIKKINFKKKPKKDSGKLELDPERDWFLILGFFTLIICTILIYGIYSAIFINKNKSYNAADVGVSIETINREKFKKILEEYNQKNLLFEEASSGSAPKSLDPSL